MDNRLQNGVVIANAIELGQAVIARVMGDDISNHLGGELVRASDVANLVAANLGKKLAKYLGE